MSRDDPQPAAVGLVPLAGLLAKVRARRGGGYGADSFAYPAAANEPVIAPARAKFNDL